RLSAVQTRVIAPIEIGIELRTVFVPRARECHDSSFVDAGLGIEDCRDALPPDVLLERDATDVAVHRVGWRAAEEWPQQCVRLIDVGLAAFDRQYSRMAIRRVLLAEHRQQQAV